VGPPPVLAIGRTQTLFVCFEQNGYNLISRHPGGVNVAFVDGHVKFKIDEIDFAVWEAIATIAGAEIIPGE
jgi:prepilin-type processing-associated H-X9-DG protein